MSLRVYNDIEQGSEEWHAVRRGIVTASVVGQLITPSTLKPANNETSRALAAALVAERITGRTEDTRMNDDMFRGVFNEPLARDKYAEHYAPVEEVGFMVRSDGPDGYRLGYSPDGLVGDDGLIEIKSPRAKTHLRTILADRVPSQYMAQLQAGLLVSGREWIDFISYSGGMPLFVKRVLPDEKWREAIVAAVQSFETAAVFDIASYQMATKDMPATEYIEPYQEASL